jgi:phytoene dehydrogenase-like protein
VFDSTMAREGKHVMPMFTQWVPESWSEEPHRKELEDYADRPIQRFELVAPGFRNLILHRQIIGPYDMEQEYGLIGGNIFHGELTVDQLFHMRPAVGYADYRTPIKGLYQASSATHASGGVNGLPGRHAVRVSAATRDYDSRSAAAPRAAWDREYPRILVAKRRSESQCKLRLDLWRIALDRLSGLVAV